MKSKEGIIFPLAGLQYVCYRPEGSGLLSESIPHISTSFLYPITTVFTNFHFTHGPAGLAGPNF
jgi:hypothetical protein